MRTPIVPVKRVCTGRRERRPLPDARGAAIAVGVCVTLLLVMAPRPATAFSRSEDPVTVAGEKLTGMIGYPISGMRLYTVKGGALTPVPFQIDERDPDGLYVLQTGPKATPDSDKGLLDANDELAFMAWDLSSKAGAGMTVGGAAAGVEIQAKDPVSGQTGYAYLYRFAGAAPRKSTRNYVRYVRAAEGNRRIMSQNYQLGGEAGGTVVSHIAVADKSGAMSPNLLDRNKFRAKARVRLIGLKLGLALDERIKSKTIGWTDGPVRLLRRGEGSMELAQIKFKGEGSFATLYYPNQVIIPANIKIPNLRAFFSSISVWSGNDYRKSIYGWKYYDPVNTKGVFLDGKMDADEQALDTDTDHDWFMVTGPAGQGILTRAEFPPDLREQLPRQTYYVDDANENLKPEAEPGSTTAGFKFDDVLDVKTNIKFRIHTYYAPDLNWNTRNTYLQIVDHPLQIRTRAL